MESEDVGKADEASHGAALAVASWRSTKGWLPPGNTEPVEASRGVLEPGAMLPEVEADVEPGAMLPEVEADV